MDKLNSKINITIKNIVIEHKGMQRVPAPFKEIKQLEEVTFIPYVKVTLQIPEINIQGELSEELVKLLNHIYEKYNRE